jgi:hypothetical protein
MTTAKHLPTFAADFAAFSTLWYRLPMAQTCGTQKLTVMVVVIPSAEHLSMTSSPARVTGSLMAMFGPHVLNRFACSYIPSLLPAKAGST